MKFQKGDKVKVIKHGLVTAGRIGVVECATSQAIEVYMDGGLGIMRYNPKSLMLVKRNQEIYNETNEGEDNMLMGNYRVCKIQFTEGTNTNREYYYALYDNYIVTGDHVVVKSANHGFGLAIVKDVVEDECVTQSMRDYCNAGREIVAKFDMLSYEERIDKRKKAKQLKADMDKKMKELQELAVFEMMAEKNPELKEMLDAYKELTM